MWQWQQKLHRGNHFLRWMSGPCISATPPATILENNICTDTVSYRWFQSYHWLWPVGRSCGRFTFATSWQVVTVLERSSFVWNVPWTIHFIPKLLPTIQFDDVLERVLPKGRYMRYLRLHKAAACLDWLAIRFLSFALQLFSPRSAPAIFSEPCAAQCANQKTMNNVFLAFGNQAPIEVNFHTPSPAMSVVPRVWPLDTWPSSCTCGVKASIWHSSLGSGFPPRHQFVRTVKIAWWRRPSKLRSQEHSSVTRMASPCWGPGPSLAAGGIVMLITWHLSRPKLHSFLRTNAFVLLIKKNSTAWGFKRNHSIDSTRQAKYWARSRGFLVGWRTNCKPLIYDTHLRLWCNCITTHA